jgi:UTP--glucose-1-phosphate uridylyltransferase
MGTRFLPATKANPKEMLPVVDKPLIHYAVSEAISAGAEELVFITGRNKDSIIDHFDKAYELEAELAQKGKEKLLDSVSDIVPPGVTCIYIRQAQALGLGHAVRCGWAAVGDEDFSVILADDLIDGSLRPCMAQMQRIYQQYGSSVIAVQRVPRGETHKYGIVEIEELSDGVSRITGIVEKPAPEDAPSNLAVVGRYILSPRIFKLLDNTGVGSGDEIQLTDAISGLLQEQTVLAYEFNGTRYDCGSKFGYLQANVQYGLKHPEFGNEFRRYLAELTASWQDESVDSAQG